MAEKSAFRALSEAAVADVIPRLDALGTFVRVGDAEYGRRNPSPKATFWTHFLRKADDKVVRLTLWAGADRGPHLQLDATVHAVQPALDDQSAATFIATEFPAGFGPRPQTISVRPSRRGQIDAIISAPSNGLDHALPASDVVRILAIPLWVLALLIGFVASWPMYFLIRRPLTASQTTAKLNAQLPRLMRDIERNAQP